MKTKNVEAKTALVYKTKTNLKEVGNVAMEHLPKMYETLGKLGLEEKEPSVFIYKGATGDMEKDFDLEIALVTERAEKVDGPYAFETVEAIKCASYDYNGDMPNLSTRYHEIFEDLDKAKARPSDEVREVYHEWIGEDSKDNKIEIQVGLN
jgi:predicted transcriptional regulator YdeE